jgi:serine/threonine protein kinase/formylglycine-generating enzyme required for sulfatase activity
MTDVQDPRPERIGPYRILDMLGEGGMGTVYLAEQKEPVRRRAALKVIKLGMDSKAVLTRFDAERKALAMMEHSCIATVFDAGITEHGQPYFAMEYVKGIPITDYCDQHKLSLQDRIALFQKVCSGVQHAHLKGVMHRDLKPSNVLVTLQDGKPVPKIIDFGLAKATDHHLVEATLFTEHGQVIGTPEYMSPEQAGLGGLDVDTRTDVYSLGVLLYELLTGALPFSRHELRAAGQLEMQRVIREQDPAKPSTKITTVGDAARQFAAARQLEVRDLQRRLRGDLDWIVLKALEKDRTRRYETALELAADLQRHLDFAPVLASPPSAGYRLRKLAQRYRVQFVAVAAVLVVLLAGIVGTYWGWLRAEDNAQIARSNESLANQRAEENARLAESERAAKSELGAKVAEFDQLAGVVLYERAVAAEQELYPPWPAKIAALENWLREGCGRLLAMRPAIERTVQDLRARALPPSDAEKEHDRTTHPRFAEGQRAGQQLASLRRAQAIRGGAPLDVPELSAEQQALDASALNALARDRVAPKAEERKVYGEEALALACARAAVAKAGDGDRFQLLDTLAWALVANGQDAEARAQSAAALASAPAEQKSSYEEYQRDVQQAIANAASLLAEAEAAHASLTAALEARRTWTFADEAPRFLHDTLSGLLDKLGRLESNEKAAVEQRLAWARRIEDVSITRQRARWDEARAAIRSSEKYRSVPIDLRPQIGLVPIGQNPVTGLWEFYELRSAWDGTGDPASIAIPAHRADGSIEVTGATGIVFVLLPGGTFTMVAQKEDPNGPNHDAQAESDERLFEVTLAPFFLARHELTQGQWQRLTGEDPSYYKAGGTWANVLVTLANPVEQISWEDCDRWLPRYGLVLPSEAQWEYGCRAGTTTPWTCAIEELQHFANLADATAKAAAPSWTCEEWSDGHVVHAPVGSFRPNGFGLFDVHGNVWEWTQDGSFPSQKPRAGDGLRGDPSGSAYRVLRGGSFVNPARLARSALRDAFSPGFRGSLLGVRLARIITE